MGCDLCGANVGGGDGVVVWTRDCLNCCSPVAKCSKDEVGNGRIMGFWEMGCDLCGASVGRVGMGVLSGLDCCSPVAKCPKDGVGNGQILGFGGMGCDLCGASVGRVGMGVLSGLGGCLNWTVVRPLPSVQRMKSATGKFWDFGRWAVISLAAMLGAWGGSVVWTGGLSELDCCSPVAKCPKDEVGNGRIMGFGWMGCDLCGASVGRGDGGVV